MPHACGHGFACSNLAGGWRYSSIAVENAAFDARPTHPCGARLHYAAGCRKPAGVMRRRFRAIMERPCETLFGQNRRQSRNPFRCLPHKAKGGAARPVGRKASATMPSLRMHAYTGSRNEPVTQGRHRRALSQEFQAAQTYRRCRGRRDARLASRSEHLRQMRGAKAASASRKRPPSWGSPPWPSWPHSA